MPIGLGVSSYGFKFSVSGDHAAGLRLGMIRGILYKHALSARTQNRNAPEDRARCLAARPRRRLEGRGCCRRYARRRTDPWGLLQVFRRQDELLLESLRESFRKIEEALVHAA